MKKMICVFLLMFNLMFVPIIWAGFFEDEDSSFGATAYSNFSQMKTRIASLMVDNKKLEAEYALLEQEMQTLQETANALEEELKIAGVDVEQFNTRKKEMESQDKQQSQESMSLQNKLLIKESKITYFKRQSLDLDDKIKSLQTEISMYESQKKNLAAKFQGHQQSIAQKIDIQSREMDILKARLESTQARYKENQEKIVEAQNLGQQYSDQMSQLIQTNKELELALTQIKADVSIKQKEVDILRDKRMLSMRTSQIELQEAKMTNAELQEVVGNLEKEYKNLDETINKSVAWQINKKDLIENIIRLDKENQGMRERIAGLQDQIEELK